MARQYSRASGAKVAKVMHERKAGTLRSGTGKKVTSKSRQSPSVSQRLGARVKKSPRNEPSKSHHDGRGADSNDYGERGGGTEQLVTALYGI